MKKKIESFKVGFYGKDYTCLLVPVKQGFSVGVAPQTLEDVIQKCIDRGDYSEYVNFADSQYGYVLPDDVIEKYLETGDATKVYNLLYEIDREYFYSFDEINKNNYTNINIKN